MNGVQEASSSNLDTRTKSTAINLETGLIAVLFLFLGKIIIVKKVVL